MIALPVRPARGVRDGRCCAALSLTVIPGAAPAIGGELLRALVTADRLRHWPARQADLPLRRRLVSAPDAAASGFWLGDRMCGVSEAQVAADGLRLGAPLVPEPEVAVGGTWLRARVRVVLDPEAAVAGFRLQGRAPVMPEAEVAPPVFWVRSRCAGKAALV